MSALPLRLYSEPIAREILGSGTFVLPSKDEETVCLIVNSSGLMAIALQAPMSDSKLEDVLELDKKCIPSYRLIRGSNVFTGKVELWEASVGPCCSCRGSSSCKVAQRIVEGIHRYYARQVLEPSIRGFLSILEKQFPRNDLYLFELLQNAVDDGASHVCFKSHKENNGLEFFHNGRGFNPLDVLGLASVGLSTKGLDPSGPKRTIGFMGVGFKAVYKRYAAVAIHDKHFSFKFEEPPQPIPNQPSHGWVLQPRHLNKITQKFWATAPVDAEASLDTSKWCRFQLERPRGGQKNVEQDLRSLPRTVPALLGRQSLRVHLPPDASWRLQWDNTTHTVTRENLSRGTSSEWSRHQLQGVLFFGAAEDITVQMNKGAMSHRWRFVTLRFSPSKEARAAYEVHTKRPWAGIEMPGSSTQYEETTLFFEVDKDGCPVTSARGAVHAVLPTKLSLPSPIQWQASWLLSVDRQEVQSVADNNWNGCMLQQIPALIGCVMQSMLSASIKSSICDKARYLKSVLSLLPPLEVMDMSGQSRVGKLSCTLLGKTVDMQLLAEFAKYSIVPVKDDNGELDFVSSHKAVWLPPSFVKLLPAKLLSCWFDGKPFASDLVDDHHCWLPLWRVTLTRPTERLLTTKRRSFKPQSGVSESAVKLNLRALAALYMASKVDVEKETASLRRGVAPGRTAEKTVSTEKEDNNSLCGGWIPSLLHWPVFIDAQGSEALATEVVWLADSFGTVPTGIRARLREGALLAVRERQGNNEKNVRLMHASLEEALTTGTLKSSSGTEGIEVDSLPEKVLADARGCAEAIRELCPANVVTPVEACRALLKNLAAQATIQPRQYKQERTGNKRDHRGGHKGTQNEPQNPISVAVSAYVVQICEELFAWAMAGGHTGAVSHLLADPVAPGITPTASSGPLLLPATRCLIGTDYKDNATLVEAVRALAAKGFYTVSPRYLGPADKAPSAVQKMLCSKFLAKCGAASFMSTFMSARPLDFHREIKPNSSLFSLKLRSTNPASVLSLPYGLGVINKKHIYEIDVSLAEEWKALLCRQIPVSAGNQVASGVVSSLLALCEATEPPAPEALPAFALSMKGKAESDSALFPDRTERGAPVPNGAVLAALKRALYLPSGQPGAALVNLGPSSWLTTLASTAWVPAAAPGSSCDAPPTLMLRPSEVVLPPGQGEKGDVNVDMPQARLPAAAMDTLRRLPVKISSALAWGTVKPKPPVVRLEALLKSLNTGDTVDSETGAVSEEVYQELSSVWRAVAYASREGRVTTSDEQKILSSCGLLTTVQQSAPRPWQTQEQQHQNKKGKHQHHQRQQKAPPPPAPVVQRKKTSTLWVLPGINGTVVRLDHCLYVEREDNEDQAAASTLSRLGVVFNCSAAAGAGWPLEDVSSDLQKLLKMSAEATTGHASDVLKACSASDGAPPVGEQWRRDSPVEFKAAYSWSLWLHAKVELNLSFRREEDIRNLPAGSAERVLKRLKVSFPHLLIYCRRGPTHGPDAFAAQWLSVYPIKSKSNVSPVLIDDAHVAAPGCGITKSSMLRPSHKLQPVALLDHSLARKDDRTSESSRLAQIDPFLLSCLGVPRMADNKKFTLRVAAGGPGELLVEPSVRLAVVLLLLQVSRATSGRSDRHEKTPLLTPQLIKHNTLTLHFQSKDCLPSAEVEKTAVSAVWGAPSQRRENEEGESSIEGALALDPRLMKHNKPMLLAGDPEDYVAELEELVITLVFGKHTGGYGDRPTKALRLLSHLEDREKFFKYLRKDFAAFFPSAADQKMREAAVERKKKEKGEKNLVDLTEDDAIDLEEQGQEQAEKEEEEELFSNLKACIGGLMDANAKANASLAPTAGKKRKIIGGEESPLDDGPGLRGPQSKEGDSSLSGAEMASSFLGSINLPAAAPQPADEASLTGVAKATGRGMTILPAWMTNKDGPSMGGPPHREDPPPQEPSPTATAPAATAPTATAPTATAPALVLDSTNKEEVVTAVARSTGRGATLLPAWMTNKDGPTIGPASSSSSSTAMLVDDSAVPAAAPQPADEASLTGVARATGRGMTILPAWMTNKDGPSMGGIPSIATEVDVEADGNADTEEGEVASARKRRRPESEHEGSTPFFGSEQYISQLNGRIEDFLMGLVAKVLQDAGESNGGLSEKNAASMIKGQLRKLLDS